MESDDAVLEARVDQALAKPTGVIKLFVGGTNAQSLPSNLHKMRGRVREVLCDNSPRLTSLSPDIGCLASTLTRLDCSNCALQSLPEELGTLVHLQFLNLSNNRLARFVWACPGLAQLVDLDLSRNRIRYFSPQVSDVIFSRVTMPSTNQRLCVDLEGNAEAFLKVADRGERLLDLVPPEVSAQCAVCLRADVCRMPHVAVRFVHIGSCVDAAQARITRATRIVKFVPILYPVCGAECALALQQWQEWTASLNKV